jgi:hypothetical protein
MDALKSDPLSLLYILTSAMGVGIFRGALTLSSKTGANSLIPGQALAILRDSGITASDASGTLL